MYISGKFSGGRKFDDIAIGEFDTPEEFLKSKYNSSGDADDMNVNSYGFSEGYMIPTNKDQDNAIRDAFLKLVIMKSIALCLIIVPQQYRGLLKLRVYELIYKICDI